MKSLALMLLLVFAQLSHAALTLRTSGRVIKQDKKTVVFETDRMRYKISKGYKKGQLFELQKINGNYYTLVADVRRIKHNEVLKSE